MLSSWRTPEPPPTLTKEVGGLLRRVLSIQVVVLVVCLWRSWWFLCLVDVALIVLAFLVGHVV